MEDLVNTKDDVKIGLAGTRDLEGDLFIPPAEDMVLMPKEESSDISSSILPSDFLLNHLPKVVLNKEDVKKVRNGQSIYYNAQLEKEGLVRIYTNKSLFMGIGELHSSNKLSPRRLIAIN